VPEAFDASRADLAWAREEIASLLSPGEIAAAARNTLNAHYTGAALVQEIWGGVQRLGFTGGAVLEPGCGSGNFIGLAPPGARVTGVELEPATAGIAAALYPDAAIWNESPARRRAASTWRSATSRSARSASPTAATTRAATASTTTSSSSRCTWSARAGWSPS